METPLSKKSSGLLRPDAAVAERCALIEAEKANYPIVWMCRTLKVARWSFYDWRDAASTPTELRRQQLGEQVASVFSAARATYGCRRVAAALNRDGTACSIGFVAELMREQGLKACQPRAYRVTTIHGGQVWRRPDLVERDFTATTPGERLVGDITYLKTGEGWLYLATVIDLATRMVTGWQLADHMRTSLIIDALEMARIGGHVAKDAIFHSDRGTQTRLNRSTQHRLVELSLASKFHDLGGWSWPRRGRLRSCDFSMRV